MIPGPPLLPVAVLVLAGALAGLVILGVHASRLSARLAVLERHGRPCPRRAPARKACRRARPAAGGASCPAPASRPLPWPS